MDVHISDLHMDLTVCGVSVEATRTLIIDNEYFTSIADFGFLDGGNDDVTAILSHMASCVANNGHVILGGIQIKKIQALVRWVRDHHKLGHPINVSLWTATVMTNAGIA